MTNVYPMIQYVLDIHGQKQHDLETFIDWLKTVDAPVIMVNAGVLPYKSGRAMGESIQNRCRKKDVTVRYSTIKGDNNRIVLFKD